MFANSSWHKSKKLQIMTTKKKNVLETEGLHVSTYLCALDKVYGADYLGFEPETLKAELSLPGPTTLDRIMAGIVIRTTSAFWDDIVAFEKAALALNNRSVSFGEYQQLSPAEMAWAVTEAGIIDDKEPMGSDVRTYVAKRLFDEGFLTAPAPLEEVQSRLDSLIKGSTAMGAVQTARHEAIREYVKQQLGAIVNERGEYV